MNIWNNTFLFKEKVWKSWPRHVGRSEFASPSFVVSAWFLLLLLFVGMPGRALAGPRVSGGGYDSFALSSNGTLWAWGANGSAQLGDGTTTTKSTPVQVGTGFAAIAAGSGHSLGLKAGGTLWAWGRNDGGQLGDGTTLNTPTPVVVGSGFTAIAARLDHSLGLKADGTLWSWGANNRGQLGDGTMLNRTTPVLVGSSFKAIAAGPYHSLGLKADGTLCAWGWNEHRQLGDGTTTNRLTPVSVGTGFTAIAAGLSHSLGLKADGTLWAWGFNGYGQLGSGPPTFSSVPFQVGGGFAAIAAGSGHSLGLKTDGTVWAWGLNGYGQLGNGTTTNGFIPVQVGTGFTAIAAGELFSLGLKADGALWAWGWNGDGQLGNGTFSKRLVPTQVLGENGVGYLNLLDGEPATALQDGVPKLISGIAANGSQTYSIEVPSGTAYLKVYFKTDAPSRLSAKQGSIPDNTDVYTSDGASLLIKTVQAGPYYLKVEAEETVTSGKIVATNYSSVQLNAVAIGETKEFTDLPYGKMLFFTLEAGGESPTYLYSEGDNALLECIPWDELTTKKWRRFKGVSEDSSFVINDGVKRKWVVRAILQDDSPSLALYSTTAATLTPANESGQTMNPAINLLLN